MLNFRQNLYVEEHDFRTAPSPTQSTDGAWRNRLPPLNSILLQLSGLLVKENNTPALYPFPGYAKMYVLSIVASNMPGQTLFINLKSFDQVDDGDPLEVEPTLYRWERRQESDTPPAHVHSLVSVIKSMQPLRDIGAILSELYRDNSYKLLAATLDNLIRDTKPLPDISNLMFNIAGIASKYLGKVEEKPLFSWYQGFAGIGSTAKAQGKTERMAANFHVSMALSLTVHPFVPPGEPSNVASGPAQATR